LTIIYILELIFGPSLTSFVDEETMIYELRIYHCLPGRLPALLKRFENTTVRLFEKHGIRQAGFWTVAIGESNQDLFYLLQWESLAERDRIWAVFQSDTEWIEARRKSEEEGPIIASISNTILNPTSFSSVK
jgi:NIPSNAP